MHHVLGCLNLATQTFPLTNAAESHTYNLKAVAIQYIKYLQAEIYILCGNVLQIAVFYSNFPGGGGHVPTPP